MKVLPSKRWVVVFDHDGSPVEGWMYVHKHKAESQISKCKNPHKYRVEQVAIMGVDLANSLMEAYGNNRPA
jgi:hypothetical protein